MVLDYQSNTNIKFDVKILKPYFDLNYLQANDAQRRQWFQNLLRLAQDNLSVAHCVQHNQTARLSVEKFLSPAPTFFKEYDQIIGCFCGLKTNDTITLNGTTVNGIKRWISLLEQSKYGIFRVVDQNQKLHYVLFDFESIDYRINTDEFNPIGMELAKPGNFIVDYQTIDPNYILSDQNDVKSFILSNFHNYCFITNYLGCATALYNEAKYLVNDSSLDKIKVSLASLHMMWQDNLKSLNDEYSTDEFWLRRNTQYVQGKSVIIDLITKILELGNSYFLDAKSPFSQRFRDALMLASHMKSLYQNSKEMHFVSC